MMRTEPGFKLHRRRFLQTTAAATASFGLSSSLFAQLYLPKTGTVRDRMWVFCNPIDADYDIVRKRTVMSPFESAVYMGAPNIIMTNQFPGAGEEDMYRKIGYKPWESPFEQYAFPLRMLKRVVWSIVGAGGVTNDSERKEVMAMAFNIPNIVGIYMDDFFHDKSDPTPASLTLDQLRDIRRQLRGPGKKLDLYVTLYTHQLDRPIGDYLALCDVVSLATWEPAELANLEANLTKLEKLAPKSRIILSCYTAAFNAKQIPQWTALPVPAMQQQCEVGLRWLRQGRIDGICIYGNFLDFEWECMRWARDWIQKVRDTPL
ncbi:MAG: twin-arginine translocation signal domain-containing protein [Terriglobia bacterium]|jgi:hypothetical protein